VNTNQNIYDNKICYPYIITLVSRFLNVRVYRYSGKKSQCDSKNHDAIVRITILWLESRFYSSIIYII